jgi:hypothetical protein
MNIYSYMILPGMLIGSGATVIDFIWPISVLGPQSDHVKAAIRGC